jgi:hypothetical protein
LCPPGNLAAIRALSKKASRLVYDLSSAKANSAAGCTAGVRYMFHYLMKDPVNADVCKKANELQAKIVSGPGSGESGWQGIRRGMQRMLSCGCAPGTGGKDRGYCQPEQAGPQAAACIGC